MLLLTAEPERGRLESNSRLYPALTELPLYRNLCIP